MILDYMWEEFCFVIGLKFGVENWTDYDDEKEPIPFRHRVFCSSLDGRPIRGKNVETLINSLKDRRPVPDWILKLANDRDGWDNYPWVFCSSLDGRPIRGKNVETLINSEAFKTLDDNDAQLKYANVRRWPALYATQPKDEVDKKSYSITGFAWAFKTWILESFRAATNDYYTRYRRLPRIGQLPVQRLVPDENEARSRWYQEFEKQKRGYKQMMEKSDDMYEKMSRFMEDMSVGPVPLAKEPIIVDQHYGISDVSGFQSYQILIRERAENDNWTLSKSDTICLHPENNRFMILTNPHIIGTLDGSMRPYPSWKDVNWVYMEINVGGVHWVTGAINLADSLFYVFDSIESTSMELDDNPTIFNSLTMIVLVTRSLNNKMPKIVEL
uniref:Ubiquitin-like protease family profile domain-containing protein n=1 Tax=Tanacetum cinerariifolium TaxID=118510 RepID=A0A6L2P2X1_TANCI|nr:hypothetical protein [Tanacetum cinerariifolium]